MSRTRVTVPALVSAACLLAAADPARAQENLYEFWPEVDAYVRIDDASRLFFLLAPVRERGEASFDDAQIGAHYEFGVAPHARKRLMNAYDADQLRYLRARVGLRRTFSLDGDDRSVSENRIVFELTPRFFLPWDLLVAQRNRIDSRWIEEEYSWRYRPRVQVERQSRVGPLTVAPYVSAELFYDSRYDSWSRTKYQAGLLVPAARWFVPEAYVAWQKDREPHDQIIKALGVVAVFYL